MGWDESNMIMMAEFLLLNGMVRVKTPYFHGTHRYVFDTQLV